MTDGTSPPTAAPATVAKGSEKGGIPVISSVFEETGKIVDRGGVYALLSVGLILTVFPTAAIILDGSGTRSFTGSDYLATLIVGAFIMVGGGTLGVLAEASVRRRIMELERLNFERLDRAATLQEKAYEHYSDMTAEEQREQLKHTSSTAELLKEGFMTSGSRPKS